MRSARGHGSTRTAPEVSSLNHLLFRTRQSASGTVTITMTAPRVYRSGAKSRKRRAAADTRGGARETDFHYFF